ncbi:MAG: DUF3592 domain-containing protein [Clostridia bacterium]|nr:DUF3592 domain-containing protein [Clostridia bacterium]
MNDNGLFILMFTGIWCLVGGIFLCVGIAMRRRWLLKDERMRARSSGTIVEVVRRTSRDSASFYPIVEFEADGRRISLESSSGGGRKRYYEGQAVEVRFDPDDPTCFEIEGDNTMNTISLIFPIVGAICIAIGVIAAAFSGFRMR